MNLKNILTDLIVHSGDARNLAFAALAQARAGDFTQAKQLLVDSRSAGKLAHGIQTRLITMDSGGQTVPLSLSMVHAQDHLMDSVLTQDLVEEVIRLYQRLND